VGAPRALNGGRKKGEKWGGEEKKDLDQGGGKWADSTGEIKKGVCKSQKSKTKKGKPE